eukprot:1137061-Pelagomonas_calceolata.AAC.11
MGSTNTFKCILSHTLMPVLAVLTVWPGCGKWASASGDSFVLTFSSQACRSTACVWMHTPSTASTTTRAPSLRRAAVDTFSSSSVCVCAHAHARALTCVIWCVYVCVRPRRPFGSLLKGRPRYFSFGRNTCRPSQRNPVLNASHNVHKGATLYPAWCCRAVAALVTFHICTAAPNLVTLRTHLTAEVHMPRGVDEVEQVAILALVCIGHASRSLQAIQAGRDGLRLAMAMLAL